MSIAELATGDGVWFKLYFDRSYFIEKIIIYYRFSTNWYDSNDHCAVVTNFKQCVDGHTNVDVSVYKGEVKQKSCGTLQLTYGLEQSDQIYTLICNAEGDTVKLSKSATFIVLSEIVVLAFSAGKKDDISNRNGYRKDTTCRYSEN